MSLLLSAPTGNLDTTGKRRSCVQLLKTSIIAPITPDGTINQGDRQHNAFIYSGILAQTLSTQNYGYTMVGGAITGGSADYLRNIGISMAGGGIVGGAADHIRNVGFSMAGGGVSGGSAEIVGTLGRHTCGINGENVIMVDGAVAKKITNKFYVKI